MGYTVKAKIFLGIEIQKDQFFNSGDKKIIYKCDKCNQLNPLENYYPKYCPDCGGIMMKIETNPNGIKPIILDWLRNERNEKITDDHEVIWENLQDKYIHCVDKNYTNESKEQKLIFGLLLGCVDTFSENTFKPYMVNWSIPQLQKICDDVEKESTKIGITGEIRQYLQLYESY